MIDYIKQFSKENLLKYILVFIMLISIFLVLCVFTTLIPSEYLKENVKKSAEIMRGELEYDENGTNYRFIEVFGKTIALDYYTDALMLNITYSLDNNDPIYSVLSSRKNFIPDKTKIIYPDTTGELKSSERYDRLNQIGELYDTVNDDIEESFEYARYWHGYTVILRPLLVLFDVSEIKLVFTTLLYILAGIFIYLLYKKIDLTIAIVFLIELIFIDYFIYGYELQGILTIFIAIITSIILLLKYRKIKNIGLYFFIIGSFTSFLDFLTTPIITVGLPICIYFLLRQKESEISIDESSVDGVKIVFAWGIGYLFTWISKWIITDVLYNKNILQSAMLQMLYRTGGTTENTYSFIDILNANMNMIFLSIELTKIIIFGILFKKVIVANRNEQNICIEASRGMPYILISILPLCVYFVLRNHSFFHTMFTYRSLMITLVCIIIALEKTIVLKGKKKKNNMFKIMLLIQIGILVAISVMKIFLYFLWK